MRERLKYALYRSLFTPLAWMPFTVLYGISDVLRLVLAKGLKYRRKVIRDNLRNSFPEKTQAELEDIERDFYAQFADNVVETAKLLHMSDRQADRRIRVEWAGLVDAAMEAGRPVVLYLGHYGNWEYVPAVTRHFSKAKTCAQVYKPLHDKAFDRLMLKVRSRFGAVSLPQDKVFRTLVRWARDKVPFICGFIADHRSNSSMSHHHTVFMGQSTPFNPGGEEIGKRINAVYLYLDVTKPKRGHYTLTFKPIEPETLDGDSPYTRRYLEMLEHTIRRRPGLWLWSHRRWLYS